MKNLLVLCAFAIASLSFADNTEFQNKADLEFAQKLIDAGYYPIALDFVLQLEKRGSLTNDQQAELQLVQANLLAKSAANEIDLNKKVEDYLRAIKVIEEFIEKYPKHAQVGMSKARIGELGLEVAIAIVETIRTETDAEKIKTLRAEANKRFESSEDFFKSQIAEREKLPPVVVKDEDGLEDIKPDTVRAELMLNLGITYHHHGLLFDPGDGQREFLLRQGADVLQEMLFAYGDLLIGFRASIVIGKINTALGLWEEARSAFENALALADFYIDPTTGEIGEFPAGVAAILVETFAEYTKAANQFRQYATTIDLAKLCFNYFPRVKNFPQGWPILLERAQAYMATGEIDLAQADAEFVSRIDPRGMYGKKARDLLSKLLTAGSDTNPSVLLRVAQSYWDKGDQDTALRMLEKTIHLAQKKPADGKFVADAYWVMGLALSGMNRKDEAVLAFLQVPKANGVDSARASEALYRAAEKLSELSGAFRESQFYQGLYKNTVDELTKKYPDTPAADRASLLLAKRLVGQGDWAGAIKIYSEVQPANKNYPEAIVMVGWSQYTQGLEHDRNARPAKARESLQSAEKSFTDALNYFQKQLNEISSDSTEQYVATQKNIFTCLKSLADIYLHRLVNKPEKVIQLFEGAEKIYGQDEATLATILGYRVRALIQAQKPDAAAGVLDVLLEKSTATSPGLSDSCRGLAVLFDQRIQDNPGSPSLRDYIAKAKRYYLAWIERGLAAKEIKSGADVLSAADRITVIGLIANGLDKDSTILDLAEADISDKSFWEQAAKLYAELQGPRFAREMERDLWKVGIKIGTCQAVLGQWNELADNLRSVCEKKGIINPFSGGPDMSVLASSNAYLEAYAGLGLAYYQLGLAGDKARFAHAVDVFAAIFKAIREAADNRLWWHARYMIVLAMFESGDYCGAKEILESMELRYPNWDSDKEGKSQFGFKSKFVNIKAKVSLRC